MSYSKLVTTLPLKKLIVFSEEEAAWYKKIQEHCSSPKKFPSPLSDPFFFKPSTQELSLIQFSEHELLSLIKISLIDKKFSEQLEQRKNFLKEFWQYLGTSLHGKAYPFHPLIEPLGLLKGKFLYFEYQKTQTNLAKKGLIKDKEAQATADALLHHAALVFYHYEALDVLAWKILEEHSPYSLERVSQALKLAQIACLYYGSAGLILLAKIANTAASKLPSSHRETKVLLYALAYKATEKAKECFESSKELTELAYHFDSSYLPSLSHFEAGKKLIFSNLTTVLSHKPSLKKFFNDKTHQRQEALFLATSYINKIQLNFSEKDFDFPLNPGFVRQNSAPTTSNSPKLSLR